MRVRVELICERPLSGIDTRFLRRAVELTCREAFPTVFGTGVTVRVEVASVSEDTIQVLNKEYRKKNKPTDILSFGSLTSPQETLSLKQKEVDLGQIVVAPDYIRRSAKEDKVTWRHEFTFVFVHGILHLMGYDHSEDMFALQDQVTEKMLQSKKLKKK